ncbi:hypothetical protein OH492_08585 [Vibrio chagasii]|nr:hypothetical protein [Vibrio chagasii]
MDWTLSHRDTELYVALRILRQKEPPAARTDERKHFLSHAEKTFTKFGSSSLHGEPAMKWFWHGDVYITMGEKVDSTAYAFRVQYKAYARWI